MRGGAAAGGDGPVAGGGAGRAAAADLVGVGLAGRCGGHHSTYTSREAKGSGARKKRI